MALEKVFETLDIEGEKQRKELQGKAETEAKKIVGEAEAEAQKLVQSHIKKMDLAIKREKARIEIEAELNKKRKVAKAKEEHTSKLYNDIENAVQKIRSDSGGYKKILKNLLEESLNEVSSKKIVVVSDKQDESLIKDVLRDLNQNYDVKISDSSISGINLEVDNSRIMVYNTFGSRLEKAKKVLTTQLTEVFFGDA